MSRSLILFRRAVLAAVIPLALVSAAAAQTDVDQEITSGTLTASIANATLTPLAYSNSAQTSTGTLNVAVNDARGLGNGWNVTVSATDFIYDDASAIGQDIPASGFQTTSASAVTVVAGQASPLPAASSFGSLGTTRKVFAAAAGSGSGQYTIGLNVSLAVPAQSQAGLYTSDLTVTVNVGP